MKIVGKIDSTTQDKCDACKKLFRRGDIVVLNMVDYDVLGWNARTVKHEKCPEK